MTYLITGATGFIGQKIIEMLLANNNNVVAFVHANSPKIAALPKHEKLKLIEIDFAQTENLEDVLTKERITAADYMIHLAWMGTTGEDRNNQTLQQENVKNSLRLLRLAYELKCKGFFFAGSQAEYGSLKEQSYLEQKETNTCYPKNEYGKAKLKFGSYLKEYQHQTTMKLYHGRIFSTYGPKDQPNSLISQLLKHLENGSSMNLGPCNHDWNFTYIDDVASLIVSLLVSDAPSGIYNMTNNDIRPLKEYIKTILETRNWNGFCNLNTREENAGDIPLRPNNKKILEIVPKEFIPFEEGIKRTIDFYEKENNIEGKRSL